MKKINHYLISSMSSIIFFLSMVNPLLASTEIGAFVGNEDRRAPYASEVQNFETLTGKHLSSVLVYWAWNDGDFPMNDLYNGVRYHDGYDTQAVLHLTWEPWSRWGSYDDTYSLADIINGTHDEYITKFAQDCRDWQQSIRLRFGHEMIHDHNQATAGWYPWQDRPTEYVQAWQHVHQIFQDQSADNVQFVWAPNNYPASLGILNQYYPGQDFVDWLGMDGYNAGEDGLPGWPYWQNFDNLFYNLYHVFIDHPEIFGDKQLMIAEFASAEGNEFGGDKAEWIRQAFTALKYLYPEVDAFYWFNVIKETDWRINSTTESLLAFQNAMQDEYFTSHVIPEPNMALFFAMGLTYMMTNFRLRKKGKGV